MITRKKQKQQQQEQQQHLCNTMVQYRVCITRLIPDLDVKDLLGWLERYNWLVLQVKLHHPSENESVVYLEVGNAVEQQQLIDWINSGWMPRNSVQFVATHHSKLRAFIPDDAVKGKNKSKGSAPPPADDGKNKGKGKDIAPPADDEGGKGKGGNKGIAPPADDGGKSKGGNRKAPLPDDEDGKGKGGNKGSPPPDDEDGKGKGKGHAAPPPADEVGNKGHAPPPADDVGKGKGGNKAPPADDEVAPPPVDDEGWQAYRGGKGHDADSEFMWWNGQWWEKEYWKGCRPWWRAQDGSLWCILACGYLYFQ